MIEVAVAGGEIAVAGPGNRHVPLFRQVDFELVAPTDSSKAIFRVSARAGVSAGSAYVAGSGTTNWPIRSLPESLIDLRLEFVGVDCAAIDPILAMAGLPIRTTAVDHPDTSVRLSGLVTGTGTIHRDSHQSARTELYLEIQGCEVALPAHEFSLSEPRVAVSAAGRFESDTIQLDSVAITTESIALDGSGTVSDCSRRAQADLSGTVLCDWEKLGTQLRPLLREDLSLSGRSRRPWRLNGPLRASSQLSLAEKLEFDVATAFDSLTFFDLNTGPLDLSAHWRDGTAAFDPVTTNFQNGRVALQPTIRFRSQTPVLFVAPGRVLENVTVDQKLCELILRYVDPLSTLSANLQARVTLDLEELEVPLVASGLEQGIFQGRIILDDMEFSPHRSLEDILATAGIQIPANLRTSQSIAVRLQNGRVYHEGLSLPLKDCQVTLDGWVALDHSLEIRLSLPVTEEMLGRDKRLYRLLRSRRIDIPITGTLEKPRVSDDALSRNIQRLIQTTLRENFFGEDALRGLLRRAIK